MANGVSFTAQKILLSRFTWRSQRKSRDESFKGHVAQLYYMFYVYVLENLVDKSWYIGYTGALERRVLEHNTCLGGIYTRNKVGKWKLIYCEGYLEKLDAIGREKFLKSGSGRRFVKKQLSNYLSPPP